MTQSIDRPGGVTAVAIVFLAVAVYLVALGGIMIVAPGAVSMALGAPLLGGLEIAGAYMFLLTGGTGALIGLGLLRLNPWARRAAIVAAFAGMIMLVPAASAAVFEFRISRLISSGLGVIVRMIIVWYLWQTPVAESFTTKPPATD